MAVRRLRLACNVAPDAENSHLTLPEEAGTLKKVLASLTNRGNLFPFMAQYAYDFTLWSVTDKHYSFSSDSSVTVWY